MSIRWTIVDEAGAAQLAEHGFAMYIDFVDRQPGQAVGRSSTTRTTWLSLTSEPRTGVRGGERAGAAQRDHSRREQTPLSPRAAAGGFDETRPVVFFIKVYRYSGSQWRHRFRRDKAALEAANYALLDEIGIGTPHVVAFGSRRRGFRLLDAVIVTRGLSDVISLDRLFELRWPDAKDHGTQALRREILDRILHAVRQMHDAGFFHIDLQWRNILIGGLGKEPSAVSHQSSAWVGRINVYFLDAPRGGLRKTPWAREHGRLRDLSCLYKEARRRLSRSEQLRWLLIYLGEDRVTAAARSMIHALSFDRVVKDNDRRSS